MSTSWAESNSCRQPSREDGGDDCVPAGLPTVIGDNDDTHETPSAANGVGVSMLFLSEAEDMLWNNTRDNGDMKTGR